MDSARDPRQGGIDPAFIRQQAQSILNAMTPKALDAFKKDRAQSKVTKLLTPENQARYAQDPDAYAREVLGITLMPAQLEAMISIRDNPRTAMMGHNSSGKTATAAVAANFFYDTNNVHIVYITGPTWDQAKELTFKQTVLQRNRAGLPGIWQLTGKILDPDRNQALVHFIKAHNAETEEAFKGEHAAPILVIGEEAVGLQHHIFAAIEALLTNSRSRALLIANPTDESSEFGLACTDGTYNVIRMSALTHPNILWQLRSGRDVFDGGPYPNAVDLRWVRDRIKDPKVCTIVQDHDAPREDEFEWVALSELNKACRYDGTPADTSKRMVYKPGPEFQASVLGIFPSQAERAVIPRAWLGFLRERGPLPIPRDRRIMPEIGTDTARFGDDRTTIFGRRGPCVLEGQYMRGADSFQVAEAIRAMAHRLALAHKFSELDLPIKVDVTGNMGTGVADTLHKWGYNVVEVNSGQRARNSELFVNRRSEMWWNMRERISTRRLDLSRIQDPQLRQDLERELSFPHYDTDGHGRKIVEEKKQLRKRMKQSPDLADGLMLSFAGYDRRARAASKSLKQAFLQADSDLFS